jgi:hypothetical protein
MIGHPNSMNTGISAAEGRNAERLPNQTFGPASSSA